MIYSKKLNSIARDKHEKAVLLCVILPSPLSLNIQPLLGKRKFNAFHDQE